MGLSEEMAEGLMAAADSHRIRQQYLVLCATASDLTEWTLLRQSHVSHR
jgi:hypothetical protein